jgi:hypothetical protein
VPGALSLAVKRPVREADHSPPTSAEVKECVEPYLHSNASSWRGAKLSTGTTLPLLYQYAPENRNVLILASASQLSAQETSQLKDLSLNHVLISYFWPLKRAVPNINILSLISKY